MFTNRIHTYADYIVCFAIALLACVGTIHGLASTTTTQAERTATITLPPNQRLVVGSIQVLDRNRITYLTQDRKVYDLSEPETYTLVIEDLFVSTPTARTTITIKETVKR